MKLYHIAGPADNKGTPEKNIRKQKKDNAFHNNDVWVPKYDNIADTNHWQTDIPIMMACLF